MLKQILITIFQLFTVVIIKLFLLITTSSKTEGEYESIKRGSLCIAANHQSELDPFVLISLMPFRDIFKILPIYFMTANVYYFSVLRPFAFLLGCFPAHPNKQGIKFGIDAADKVLKSKSTFFIFPEGKRVRRDRTPAKKGVYEILKLNPHSQLLLARIQWKRYKFYRRKLYIKYYLTSKGDFKNAQEILDRIYDL